MNDVTTLAFFKNFVTPSHAQNAHFRIFGLFSTILERKLVLFDAIFRLQVSAQIALRPTFSVIFAPKFSKAPLATSGS